MATMKGTRKPGKSTSAENIARLAESGEDVSRFFMNSGGMKEPIQRRAEEPYEQGGEEPMP
jgi:hypothetical protein